MTIRFGISEIERKGRLALRVIKQRGGFELKQINQIAVDAQDFAHL